MSTWWTEKKVFRASNEKISIRQGIRSFVPCIVKGINNHMFQSTQMGLLGSLDCWRCVGRDPGSRLGFVFTSLVIIIIIFLHRTFCTWTSAPGMQQRLISRDKWSGNFVSRDGTQSYSSSHLHNLFIVLTGFLRIWWNHKHRTENFQNRISNREIKRNSSISFAAKEELLSEPGRQSCHYCL